MKKIRNFVNYIKKYIKIKDIENFVIKNKNIIYMALPFLLMDISTRSLGYKVNFFKLYSFVPNFFTLIWIALFISISINTKKKISRTFYLIFSSLGFLFYLINNVYYSMTNNFFDFSLLEMTSEGSVYFIDAIKNCNPVVYIIGIFAILLIILGYKHVPKNKDNNFKILGISFVIFIILHIITPLFLGKANDELSWNTWRNPHNIYKNFNDNNKSMQISGLYEYTVRNFYINYLKPKQSNSEQDLEFLKNIYDNTVEEELIHENSYTGLFNGKNVIFLQFEGIDSFLLTSDIMPNTYSLLNNSINFTNHYSYYNGGGSTFNSEFAVNTGFFTPLSYNQNAYTFNKNNFKFSLANMFKKAGYSVNAFHMNTSEYYSRGTNYNNWGYDNYYGLKDLNYYKDNSYNLDTELINNPVFNELMFPSKGNFMNYIITYSNHMPFSNLKGVCKQILEKNTTNTKDISEENYSELDCLKIQAKETDDMVGLLIENLTNKGLIDNTVIIAYTDHYLYTLEDASLLDNYKITSNNLINKTPFFIWSNDISKETIKKVTSQLNILPTTLNLFGLEYHPNYYIGEDALDDSYSGYVFFSDYSWYDGNVYVDGGIVTNGANIDESVLEEKNYYISYLIKKNDLTLKYNYFKNIKNKESK